MALQGPLSTMEGTNGNYEPMNGRLGGSRGIFGSGTFAEGLVEPQITDLDGREYSSLKSVLAALEGVEHLCAAIMEKLKTPEGPGSSQSAVSKCSTEKTASQSPPLAAAVDKFTDNRKKDVPPMSAQPFIDLTSEDSCDTGTSRRPGQEETAGQDQSSPIHLSDDDEADVNKKEFRRSPQADNAAPQVKVDDSVTPEVKVQHNADPLGELWEIMNHVKKYTVGSDEAGVHIQVQEPILPQGIENCSIDKRRKGNDLDDVSYNVNYKYQPMPWAREENELLQVEPISVSRQKRGRGRPRKEDSIRKEDLSQDGVRDLLELPWTVDTTQNHQVDAEQANLNQVKEKNPGKGEKGRDTQLEKKRKRKVDVEDLLEDEVDEEEEVRKPGVPDLAEELIKHSSKLNKEKVDYEPYVRRKYEEEEDELEDYFMEAKTHETITLEPSSDMTTCRKDEGICDHKNFDFEDGVGYYCEDCGTEGIEMPMSSQQNNSVCAHKNYEFTDEAGIYCPDCGKVFEDIQSCFVASDGPKALRKQGQKLQDVADGLPRVQLNLQSSGSIEDFHGADFELHPYFEDVMHPHQMKGFKFLTEHLLGGQQPNNEAMGCILAHKPGTGKTCLVISFIQSFLSKFPNGRPLILAPKIMLDTWEQEFDKWQVQEVKIYRLGASNGGNFCGDGEIEDDDDEDYLGLAHQLKNTWKEERAMKLREWQASRGVLLTSYKLFTNLVMNGLGENVLPESLDYQMSKVLLEATNLVILDEGHVARNINAQITKSLLAMETKRKVVLSGTLFHNTFKELYTVLKLCRDDFMTTHPQYGKRIAELAAISKRSSDVTILRAKSKKDLMQIEEKIFIDEIGEKLERYVRDDSNIDEIEPVVKKLESLTKFVDWYPGGILKGLPGLHEYSVHLNLTEFQLNTIKSISNKGNHMARQCAIITACIHPSLYRADDTVAELRIGASSLENYPRGAKIVFLVKLMAECRRNKEKLLIFCCTLEPLRYIEELFCNIFKWNSGKHVLRLDGKMQDVDRQKVIVEFNKGSDSYVLLASTKACKEGISLVGASRVVVLDCPDNPSVVRQAISRAFRIGQKKKVFVYRLVSKNPEEEAIFSRSVNKERLSQVLSDPAYTTGRVGGFLQEQGLAEVEDQLLKRVMRKMADLIDTVYRYNAMG